MALIPVSVDILAIVLLVILVVKLLFLAISPGSWISLTKKIYSLSWLTMVVFIVLAYLVLENLLDAGITLTQIFAVALFVSLLMGVSVAAYAKELLPSAMKIAKGRGFWKKAWLPVLVWIALSVMVILELLA